MSGLVDSTILPKQIGLSHNEAGKVIIPPVGNAFSLEEKSIPICDRPGPYDDAYAKTRGMVDVSAFKKKLLTMPPETWEDAFQQGITKINYNAYQS